MELPMVKNVSSELAALKKMSPGQLREKYLEETPARLLPILREAGETWFVERLEGALEELAGTRT